MALTTWQAEMRRRAFPMSHEDSWQSRARCRDSHAHLFFPRSAVERKEERENRERRAQAICRVCTVTQECLDFALDIQEPYGIWGGRTEAQRRELLAGAAT